MAEQREMRSCSKTACRWPAAASLSYRYDTRQVWLLDLSGERDPALYDLCPHHADTLVVMRGWERVDQRTHVEPVVEPAGRDLLPESGRPPVGAGGYGASRYTELVEDLPRLAAMLAEEGDLDRPRGADGPHPPLSPVGGETGEAGEATGEAIGEAAGAARPHDAGTARTPVPSRDLAPVPAAEPPPAPPADPAPEPADQVPGQLAIPVSHDEPAVGEAVVVSISEASSRRRVSTSS